MSAIKMGEGNSAEEIKKAKINPMDNRKIIKAKLLRPSKVTAVAKKKSKRSLNCS